MTPDEVERMNELFKQIAVEKDQKKFTELIRELNELLDRKNKRLHNPQPHPPTSDTKI